MALIDSASSGNLPQVRELLVQGNHKMEIDQAMLAAVEHCHLEVVEELLKHGANIHAAEDQAFTIAVRNGQLSMICLLLDKGANIDIGDGFALTTSAMYGRASVVRELLNRGSAGYIHVQNDLALYLATQNDHPDTIRELLSRGANFDRLAPNVQEKYRYLLPGN